MSMLEVAYLYDNKSWGYIHLLNGAGTVVGKQLDIDKITKAEMKKKHLDMIQEKITKLKEGN